MGQCISIPADELHSLLKETHFKEEDLQRWYRRFIRKYPEGGIDQEQFQEVYGQLYNSAFSNHFSDHLFRSLDVNNNGFVSFKEFITPMSISSHGTWREQLKFVFDVYDVCGNGRLTLDDVRHVVVCLQNDMVGISDTSVISEERLVEMFRKFDYTSKGYWTFEDFLRAKSNSVFMEMLRMRPKKKK